MKIVKETLPLAGKPYVETTEIMTRYNPFFEKAGTQKVAEQLPAKQVLRISEMLSSLGFSVQLLGSRNYVLKKLQLMRIKHLTLLRQAFIQHNHQRFQKEFSPHQPYGKFEKYKTGVEKADLKKLAKLIKICGMLLQTKVYLFWKNQKELVKSIKISLGSLNTHSCESLRLSYELSCVLSAFFCLFCC